MEMENNEKESSDMDISSSDEEQVDNSMEKTNKKRKMNFSSDGENSRMSKMCHQSDKDRLVCCSNCKDKEFRLPCIKQRNSEAGIGTELCLSSSISKTINEIPGQRMPKCSSVFEDPSRSMAANREENVVASEDEEPRTDQLILYCPPNKAEECALVPSQAMKQLINIDEDVESTFVKVQSFLKSLQEQQSGLEINSTTTSAQIYAKLIYECSIRLPLTVFADDPMKEKEVHDAIVALSDNSSALLSDEQAKELRRLKFEFPFMVKKLRDSGRSNSSCKEFFTSFEEDRGKLDDWIRSEQRLKEKYEKKEEEARELEERLQDIRTMQKEINDERQQRSRESKNMLLLSREKAGKIESMSNELVTTEVQMDGLLKKWSNLQSLFP